jgi:hypothetical protein
LQYESYFDGITIPFEADGFPPSYRITGRLFPTESEIGGGNSFAYGVVHPPRLPSFDPINRTVDFFALAWVDDLNSTSQSVVTEYDQFIPNVGIIHVTSKSTRLFDGQGTGLTYRTFHKYNSTDASDDARLVSDRLGNSGYVEPTRAPEAYTFVNVGDAEYTQSSEQLYFGYYIAQHVAITRWDVEGGFVFVKP